MFYSQFILAKKGPLGTIWIAAHLERKLRKNQVADTDIGASVDSILFPDAPIALRLSSHLLLGVVRIYSRKVGYLFDDCSDALLKVKQAFRSTAVDLPPEESTAPYHSITLPETFDLDDFELPDTTDILDGNYVDHHVSSREQITLQDNMEGVVFSTSQFGLDERFGDGDTSGLDLDELDNQVRQADTAGYAQAPCTPGLAEEPNLSTAQEAYVCDDHPELEEEPNFSKACEDNQDPANYNATNLSTEDNFTRMTTNLDFYSGKENEASGSLLNDVNPATGSDGQKINDLNTLADYPSPAWTPFPEGHVEAMSPASEYPGEDLTLLNGVNGIQNEVISNDGQEIPDQLAPKTFEVGQLSLEPLNLNGVEGVENMENSYPLSNSVATNIKSPSRNYTENFEIHSPEHQNDPKFSSLTDYEKTEIADAHVLKPCKSLNQSSATIPDSNVPVAPHWQFGVPEICSMEALGSNEARPLDSFIKFQELALFDNSHNNQSEFGTSNDQDNNVLSVEPQLYVSNENMISELPEPEKLLSAPVGHEDDQVHLLESTPNREHSVLGDVDDTRTNIIFGKRSFTESTLTVDSLISFESLGVVQSKRFKDSVPDDNDLLSSILGGRYSALKLKPTPPPEKTSKKRPRSTARVSSSKRKVIVDDNMVLHGDQIRQQLTHTGDIRRMRKKAPCTRAEIWMIRKEFLDEEIFTEPIFTGFSSGLASIYSHAYNLSETNLLINEAQKETQEAICHEMPVHADINLDKETEKEVNQESILVNSAMEVQSHERQQDKSPLQTSPLVHSGETSDMHINGKINSTSDAINPLIVNGVESIPEVHSGETFDLHINGDSNLTAYAMNPSIVNGVESNSLVDPVSVDKLTGYMDLSNGVQLDAAADALHYQRLETQFSEMEAFDLNASSENVVDANICGEDLRAGNEFSFEQTEFAGNSANILTANDPRDHFLVTSDEVMEGFNKNELGVVNEVENAELDVDGTFPIVYDSGIDPAEASAHHVEVLNSDVRGVSFSDAENHGCKSPNLQNEMNPQNDFVDYNAAMDHTDLEYNVDGHDTGFLNEDDDEINEEGDDCAPSAAHIGFIDNSGWSSRTRAVAKYLQVLFDKETEQGKNALPMNNLLVGKTRKEASRMFFEALVLKTRDYIHVEQEAPFDNINLKPRGKLMKADF